MIIKKPAFSISEQDLKEGNLKEKGIQDLLYSHLKNTKGSIIIVESDYGKLFVVVIFTEFENTIHYKADLNDGHISSGWKEIYNKYF